MDDHILQAERLERARQRQQQERDRLIAECFLLLSRVAESPYCDLALPNIRDYCKEVLDRRPG